MAVGCRILIFPAEARSLSPCSLLTLREGSPPSPVSARPADIESPRCQASSGCSPTLLFAAFSPSLSQTRSLPSLIFLSFLLLQAVSNSSLSPQPESLRSPFLAFLLRGPSRPSAPARTAVADDRAAGAGCGPARPPARPASASPIGRPCRLGHVIGCRRHRLSPARPAPVSGRAPSGPSSLRSRLAVPAVIYSLGERGRAGCPLRACAVRARAGSGKGRAEA